MRTRFIIFTVMIIAVFWVNALLDMGDRRGAAIREAEREASTLALTLEEQVRNSVAAADLTLRLIVRIAEENDWTEARADDPAIQAILQQMTADVSQINNLVITDRDGRFLIQRRHELRTNTTGEKDRESKQAGSGDQREDAMPQRKTQNWRVNSTQNPHHGIAFLTMQTSPNQKRAEYRHERHRD